MNVVLSGSGVNFGIHIGALEKIGEIFSIKSITGTSGGSLAACLYAHPYFNITDIKTLYLSIDFQRLGKYNNYFTILVYSVIYNDKRINKLLKDIFKDIKLKELKIPVAIVATEIETSNQIIFSSTNEYADMKVWEAVRASMAAPFIFKHYKGYYDGGLVNNTPVDVAIDHFNVRNMNSLIGIKIIPPKTKYDVSEIEKPFNWKKKLQIVLSTLFESLDREHIEEASDRIVFIKCDHSPFDFNLSLEEKNRHLKLGRESVTRFLQGRENGVYRVTTSGTKGEVQKA